MISLACLAASVFDTSDFSYCDCLNVWHHIWLLLLWLPQCLTPHLASLTVTASMFDTTSGFSLCDCLNFKQPCFNGDINTWPPCSHCATRATQLALYFFIFQLYKSLLAMITWRTQSCCFLSFCECNAAYYSYNLWLLYLCLWKLIAMRCFCIIIKYDSFKHELVRR